VFSSIDRSQCCYDESYCGNGLNAWSSACKAGKSKLERHGKEFKAVLKLAWAPLVICYIAMENGN
jgi:hypothetical protein